MNSHVTPLLPDLVAGKAAGAAPYLLLWPSPGTPLAGKSCETLKGDMLISRMTALSLHSLASSQPRSRRLVLRKISMPRSTVGIHQRFLK